MTPAARLLWTIADLAPLSLLLASALLSGQNDIPLITFQAFCCACALGLLRLMRKALNLK